MQTQIEKIYNDATTRRGSVATALAAYHTENDIPLRHQREDNIEAMRLMLDTTQGRKLTAQEDSDWKELERATENLNRQIALDNARLDADAANHFGAPSAPNGWFDTATRQPVNVYGPSDRLSGSDRPQSSVGDLIKARVTGRGTNEAMNALEEGTDSSGGFLVPEPLSRSLIDLMRAKTRIIQAGARTVSMNAETLSIAGIAADPTPAWRMENAMIAESEPTFNRLKFTARWLGVMVKSSRELIEDSPNAGDAITQSVAGALAVEWDRVALLGSGVAPEPLGLANTSGVFNVEMGADGAALTGYSELLQAVALTTGANAERPTAMVMAPRTLYSGFAGLTAADGQPLMAPAAIADVPMLDSSNVPIDETQGTATDASRIVLGDFRQMLLGIRSELRIEIMPQVFAQNHQLAIIAWLRADVQVAQPKAFAQITGVIPAA